MKNPTTLSGAARTLRALSEVVSLSLPRAALPAKLAAQGGGVCLADRASAGGQARTGLLESSQLQYLLTLFSVNKCLIDTI